MCFVPWCKTNITLRALKTFCCFCCWLSVVLAGGATHKLDADSDADYSLREWMATARQCLSRPEFCGDPLKNVTESASLHMHTREPWARSGMKSAIERLWSSERAKEFLCKHFQDFLVILFRVSLVSLRDSQRGSPDVREPKREEKKHIRCTFCRWGRLHRRALSYGEEENKKKNEVARA